MKEFIGNKEFEGNDPQYKILKKEITAFNAVVSRLKTEFACDLKQADRGFALGSNTQGTPCFRAYMETIGFDSLQASRNGLIEFYETRIATAKQAVADFFERLYAA